MTMPRKQHRYRWGRIGLAVIALPAIALGIASGVKYHEEPYRSRTPGIPCYPDVGSCTASAG